MTFLYTSFSKKKYIYHDLTQGVVMLIFILTKSYNVTNNKRVYNALKEVIVTTMAKVK